VVPRRDGDIEKVCADAGLANRELGWQAETTLKEIMRLAWKREQKLNEEK
jgi:UDP-glucose 4-epimerase